MLFRILIQDHRPEVYDRRWHAALDEYIRYVARGASMPLTDEQRTRFEMSFRAGHPYNHTFNDLAGFAEVFWDGGSRILISAWFRADARRPYGRALRNTHHTWRGSRKFYWLTLDQTGGMFTLHLADSNEMRRAAMDALDAVEAVARDNGCWVDTQPERALVACIDWAQLLVQDAPAADPDIR